MNICVGDKVRVKALSTLRRQNNRRCSQGIIMDNSSIVFNNMMKEYCGKTFKVKFCDSMDLTLEDDKGTVGWHFTEAMLVKVEK